MIEEIELPDATGDGCSLSAHHGTASNGGGERIEFVARDGDGDSVLIFLGAESVTELRDYLSDWLNAEVAP